MPTPESSPEYREAIESASKEWKNSLLDVGGNNRLLYFKQTSGQLDLKKANEEALQQLLGGKSVPVTRLFPDSIRAADAVKACRKLAAKQKEAVEEYGVSVTYLALGLASWGGHIDATTGHDLVGECKANSKKPVPNAPIFLRSVSIERKGGHNESWTIKLAEDMQLNGVLTHVLKAEGALIDEDALLSIFNNQVDNETVLADAYEALSVACADVRGFKATPANVIGTFTYQKQPMVNDVTDINALMASDLVAALAGNAKASSIIRSSATNVDVSEHDPDYTPPESEFLVLDADASQSFVVNAAIAGRNLVVQGPPGTGKSQTIANVIAALIAEGKHVLFVAQKRAAIEAVLDRLKQVGLDHLLLDLFAADNSRRFVSEQLRASLERQNTVTLPDVSQLHDRLERNRTRLVSHKDALFDASHGWGISISELRIKSSAVPSDARRNLRLPTSTFQNWTPSTLEELAEDLDSLYRLGALAPGWADSSHWNCTSLQSREELQRGLTAAQHLQGLLHSTQHRRDLLAEHAGYGPPTHWHKVSDLVTMHRSRLNFRESSPEILEDPDIDAVLASLDHVYRKANPGINRQRIKDARRRHKSAFSLFSKFKTAHRSLYISTVKEVQYLRQRWHTDREPFADIELNQIDSMLAQARDASTTLSTMTSGSDIFQISFDELKALLDALVTDENVAHRFVSANELQAKLRQHGLEQVIAMIRNHLSEGKELSSPPSEILRWVTFQSILNDAIFQSPELATFQGEEIVAITDQFQKDDKKHLAANAARVRRRAAEFLKTAFDDFPDQHSLLRTEVTRKREFRPVRKLLAEAPNVLLASKPVWVMSPLQVSRVLPANQCFDVVIFDEASQVKPADAVPALMRAKQAIVAGDSWQLPPTEFFSKVMEDTDTEDEEIELSSAASGQPVNETPRQSYTRDAESILISMDRLLVGQSRSLQWHYRSRDERLIATSNEHIYHRSLITFPAIDSIDAVRHVAVPPSRGIGSTTNSPELEVMQVVDLVKQHVQEHSSESLGVITFGIKHQQRIEAALDEAMRQDPEFEAALSSSPTEPFFVKAIERVQGDERDSIILAVGYGKGLDGKLRYFWGPILRDGGERRLNVAISRAKRRMTLVTSFSADDLAVDAHPSAGYKLMYHFTRFMASRGENLRDGNVSSVPLNPFEIDVKTRLEAAGLALDTQVGVGQYRIDFAVRHPEKPGRHVLAVEADGRSYHSGHTARERDRLRQQLLEARGWRFHRIWSTDWFNNADTEVEKVIQSYKAALLADENGEPSIASDTKNEQYSVEEKPQRSLPRPPIARHANITDYPDSDLISLLTYIRSDNILRSAEDEKRLMKEELGFSRLGPRIARTLERIQQFDTRS